MREKQSRGNKYFVAIWETLPLAHWRKHWLATWEHAEGSK